MKLTSGNDTAPSRVAALQGYASGAGGWYERVFAADPHVVAVEAKKYELMRFWLLGSWMAAQTARHFTLVSLTRETQDVDLDDRFAPLILQNSDRRFMRRTWESIAEWASSDPATAAVSDYLASKAVGYDSAGQLQHMLARTIS